MNVRKAQAAGLQLLKTIIGGKSVTVTILGGPLKGYKWTFDATSNNELIFGMWESNMQSIYARYLRPGNVVFDLGAHQGFLAMLAGRLVGDEGNVYAFEASPTNFEDDEKYQIEQRVQLYNDPFRGLRLQREYRVFQFNS